MPQYSPAPAHGASPHTASPPAEGGEPPLTEEELREFLALEYGVSNLHELTAQGGSLVDRDGSIRAGRRPGATGDEPEFVLTLATALAIISAGGTIIGAGSQIMGGLSKIRESIRKHRQQTRLQQQQTGGAAQHFTPHRYAT